MPKDLLKIAWFSELPDDSGNVNAESLSAYFSKLILPHLKDKFDITLYHNSFSKYQGYKTFHYLKAFEHDKTHPYDIFFYQLEDSARLNFVRSHIGLIPGVTYFHHFNLTNYGPEPLLNSPYTDIVENYNNKKFSSNVTDWPDRTNKYKPKGPGAFREAALSPVAVFSTSQSLNEYKNQVKLKLNAGIQEQLNAFYLPYPVGESSESEKAYSDKFSVCFAGSTRIERRAHKVLSAIADFDREIEFKWLLPAAENNQAALLLEEYGIKNFQLHNKFNSDQWRRMVKSADCAVHTLFSVYGHNEPYLGISISEGKPCIVTDFASTESLPENLVIKIQPGDHEAFQIKEVLDNLKSGNLPLNTEALQQYAAEMFSPAQIASELSDIFRRRKDYLCKLKSDWDRMQKNAMQSLVAEADSFIDKENTDFRKFLKPALEELGWIR